MSTPSFPYPHAGRLGPETPHTHPGCFIAIDGVDGVGKSTLVPALAETIRRQTGREVLMLREPGGTVLGEDIRRILLDPTGGDRTGTVDLFLFSAARAQLISEQVRPALRRGAIVLVDRFVPSTYVYQGAAGVDESAITAVTKVAVAECWPDVTAVLTLDASTLAARLADRPGAKDRFEAAASGALAGRIAQYITLANRIHGGVAITAHGTPDEVLARVFDVIRPALEARGLMTPVPARVGRVRAGR